MKLQTSLLRTMLTLLVVAALFLMAYLGLCQLTGHPWRDPVAFGIALAAFMLPMGEVWPLLFSFEKSAHPAK
jgi:hypothetical protein